MGTTVSTPLTFEQLGWSADRAKAFVPHAAAGLLPMAAMMKFADPQMMSGYVDMMTDPEFMDAMMKMMDPELMTQMMAAMFKMSMAMPAAMAGAGESLAPKDDSN